MMNIQIKRAITNFANILTVRKSQTTRPAYINVQFHPGSPDIKGILHRYTPLLHQSVTMKTAVPDLPMISFSQPPNWCYCLCRAKLRQPASVIDQPPRPSQSCGKSRFKLYLSLICSNYFTSTVNNKTFKCNIENTCFDSKSVMYVISYVSQSNNLRARMNGHKRDFRLYVAGKINKMDNELLYDHLIYHDIDYFQVCFVDLIRVDNYNGHHLEKLLSRKEHKWIWDFGSITLYDLNQDDGFNCQSKRCSNRYVHSRTVGL